MTQIYLFPGEGSQRQGMGEGLFGSAAEMVNQVDAVFGGSVVDLCLNNPQKQLDRPVLAAPAVFLVNALNYRSQLKFESRPEVVAGRGLGEYNALLAADVFDFQTGLYLLQKRTELLSRQQDGAMASIVGLTTAVVKRILVDHGFHAVDIACCESPTQTVISGPQAHVENAVAWLQQAGAKRPNFWRVSGAFYSRYLREAAVEFAEFASQFAFNKPRIPVVANTTAKPYADDHIAEQLAAQLCNSILWVDSIRYLKSLPSPQFAEVGPGRALLSQLHLIT